MLIKPGKQNLSSFTPENVVQASPNPFNNQLMLDIQTQETIDHRISVEMYNIQGQKVAAITPQSNTTANSQQSLIDTNHLPNGIYLIKTQIGGQVYTNKVIKQ